MKFKKKKLATMNKCYAIAPFNSEEGPGFLVASEKPGPCVLFNLEGEILETIWEEPGGTMTLCQLPEDDLRFFATHRFYSPNDSKDASIVMAAKNKAGKWQITNIAVLPHVHRFGFLQGHKKWLIAATLCSGRDFKDDWSHPGKIYVGEVNFENLEKAQNTENSFPAVALTPIMENLSKNHGYWQGELQGVQCAVIASENGVFCITPPQTEADEWASRQITSCPASDITFIDFDENGKPWMLVISPFHGETISLWKPEGKGWKKDVTLPGTFPFAHAIWGGKIGGVPAALIGHRQGKRDLLLLRRGDEGFLTEVIDHDVGPANVWCFEKNGLTNIVCTNREIDEIALYTVLS